MKRVLIITLNVILFILICKTLVVGIIGFPPSPPRNLPSEPNIPAPQPKSQHRFLVYVLPFYSQYIPGLLSDPNGEIWSCKGKIKVNIRPEVDEEFKLYVDVNYNMEIDDNDLECELKGLKDKCVISALPTTDTDVDLLWPKSPLVIVSERPVHISYRWECISADSSDAVMSYSVIVPVPDHLKNPSQKPAELHYTYIVPPLGGKLFLSSISLAPTLVSLDERVEVPVSYGKVVEVNVPKDKVLKLSSPEPLFIVWVNLNPKISSATTWIPSVGLYGPIRAYPKLEKLPDNFELTAITVDTSGKSYEIALNRNQPNSTKPNPQLPPGNYMEYIIVKDEAGNIVGITVYPQPRSCRCPQTGDNETQETQPPHHSKAEDKPKLWLDSLGLESFRSLTTIDLLPLKTARVLRDKDGDGKFDQDLKLDSQTALEIYHKDERLKLEGELTGISCTSSEQVGKQIFMYNITLIKGGGVSQSYKYTRRKGKAHHGNRY